MDNQIKIGDKVIRKSNESIKMTVNDFVGSEEVQCIYFNMLTRKFEYFNFNIAAIEHY